MVVSDVLYVFECLSVYQVVSKTSVKRQEQYKYQLNFLMPVGTYLFLSVELQPPPVNDL